MYMVMSFILIPTVLAIIKVIYYQIILKGPNKAFLLGCVIGDFLHHDDVLLQNVPPEPRLLHYQFLQTNY